MCFPNLENFGQRRTKPGAERISTGNHTYTLECSGFGREAFLGESTVFQVVSNAAGENLEILVSCDMGELFLGKPYLRDHISF